MFILFGMAMQVKEEELGGKQVDMQKQYNDDLLQEVSDLLETKLRPIEDRIKCIEDRLKYVNGAVYEKGRVTEPRTELFRNKSDGTNLEVLRDRLRAVKDWYWGFERAVICYAKEKTERATNVLIFMISKPEATTFDILKFISDQPDFLEDAAHGDDEKT